jgi:hypothetical protein
MKILVRRSRSTFYLNQSGNWGSRPDAQEFPDLRTAGLAARRHTDADVVISYEQPECELALNPVYCAPRIPPRLQPGGLTSIRA